MDGKKIGGILVSVAVIGLIVVLRFRQRSEDSAEVRELAMSIISSMDEYEANQAILKTMGDRAHDIAFDAAYTMAGRRTRAKFDEDAYLDAFLRSMIDQASQMGRTELKQPLIDLHRQFRKVQQGDSEGEAEASSPQSAQRDPPSAPSEESAAPRAEVAARDADAAAGPGRLGAAALAELDDKTLVERLIEDIRVELGDRSGVDGVKAIRALSPCRRAIFMVQWVDRIVREDGLNELFGDEFGPLAVEAVKSFDAVGAKKRAVIMRRAIAAFVRENPDQTVVKKSKTVKKYLDAHDDGSIADVDAAYDKSKENLNKLCIKYIRANAAECVVSASDEGASGDEASSGE